MKRSCFFLSTILCLAATFLSADTIILRDGSSYFGQCETRTISFTDQQGVGYQFPAKDVQSLVFNSTQDTVTLRGGKSYTGHFTGTNSIAFQDFQGVRYQFPARDIVAIVFNSAGAPPPRPVGGLGDPYRCRPAGQDE